MNDNAINIIIPVRDRDDDLHVLLAKLEEFIEIDYQIIIIEQSPGKEFNKGILNNSGFIEAKKTNFSDYYIFTDVDIIPTKKSIIPYTCMSGMHHLYGNLHCLGGVFATDKTTYETINGFSNTYWGWGAEDSDFQLRCEMLDIPINRSRFIKRLDLPTRYAHFLSNEKNLDVIDYSPVYHNENRLQRLSINSSIFKQNCEQYKKDIRNIQKDGINNCNYTILKFTQPKKNIRRIVVEI